MLYWKSPLPSALTISQKRGRGRPRKYPLGESPAEKALAAQQNGPKRGRGRPRKLIYDIESAGSLGSAPKLNAGHILPGINPPVVPSAIKITAKTPSSALPSATKQKPIKPLTAAPRNGPITSINSVVDPAIDSQLDPNIDNSLGKSIIDIHAAAVNNLVQPPAPITVQQIPGAGNSNPVLNHSLLNQTNGNSPLPVVKRGRGRPPKKPRTDIEAHILSSILPDPTPKRRGRPRKYPRNDEVSRPSTGTGKRGRPRKVVVPALL